MPAERPARLVRPIIRPIVRPTRTTRAAAALTLAAAAAACAAGAAGGPATRPVAGSAPPTDCLPPATGGGAAPPTLVDAASRAAVDRIVQRLLPAPGTAASDTATDPAPLEADTAVRLRQALCDAGLWQHPGLDRALAPWGLSRKRIDAASPAASPAPATGASVPGRRIPPPEGATRR